MTITYYLTFVDASGAGATLSADELARAAAVVGATPGLKSALIHTPGRVSDPYLDDGPPPLLTLQLYFADLPELEAALARDGHLQALASPMSFPTLARAAATQQSMLVRRFPVPDPVFRTPAGAPHCSFLVAYEGPAEDLNLWLDYYIAHHPPIMARFPGIRQIEIDTRIDWCGFLPWPRVDCMQRNKVVFDDGAALDAALNSAVRHELRADFTHFPRFSGATSHYPMATTVLAPSR